MKSALVDFYESEEVKIVPTQEYRTSLPTHDDSDTWRREGLMAAERDKMQETHAAEILRFAS